MRLTLKTNRQTVRLSTGAPDYAIAAVNVQVCTVAVIAAQAAQAAAELASEIAIDAAAVAAGGGGTSLPPVAVLPTPSVAYLGKIVTVAGEGVASVSYLGAQTAEGTYAFHRIAVFFG